MLLMNCDAGRRSMMLLSCSSRAIYDKSDIENVSDAYLRSLVQQIETDGSR